MKFWNKFPRKLGVPFKTVCATEKEFIDQFNLVNGTMEKVYIGLYACELDGSMNNVELNVFSYDIDWADKYNSVVELHNHLNKLGWFHQVFFSTNGFWIHVYVDPKTYDKDTAKKKLAAVQELGLKGTSLKFGKPKESAIDFNVRGDIERLTRCPFSYDKTRERFAIFLSQEDIDKGMDHIIDVSTNCDKERRFKIYTFGDRYGPDLDTIPINTNKFENKDYSEISEGEYNLSIPENTDEFIVKVLSTMPKCMQSWIVDYDMATWKARAYITLYMKERGFTRDQVRTVLKPFYEKMATDDRWKNRWEHYTKSAQADVHIFRRSDLKFPNCQSIYEEGLCKGCENLKKKHFSLVYRHNGAK